MSDVRLELGPSRALLVVDRPDVRNAIGLGTIAELEAALAEVERWQEKEPRAVVLLVTGAGGSFVSGGDLRELRDLKGREEADRLSERMQRALNRLEDLPIPVWAALDGPAVGGGVELALACDGRIMAEDAYLHFAQTRLGVVTGWGGGPRLVELVGWRRALSLLASASRVSAAEAQALGLADRLAPSGEALVRAEQLAERLAASAPLAIRSLKALMRGFAGADRRAAQEAERSAFALLWDTEDHGEAIVAALEGRPPAFLGS